ncbi:TrmB family transcriptional regulator [Nanoarchaeota archaeon]
MKKGLLKQLGFTNGEEKVYLSLLKLGASTTGPIAKESNVSRSKLYEILEKLSRKGIVSHYKKNNISYFRAAPPTRIIDFLKDKEDSLVEQRKEFEKNLPLFESIIGKKEVMKEAEVFEGMEGIRNVREIALNNMKSGDIMFYFGNPASGYKNVLGYWNDWNKRRIKKKITSKIIYNQDAKEFGEERKKQKYTEVKYLPKKGNSHAWIEIYGDTVVIAMKHKTPMSIVINNGLVAESFKLYFDILWDVSLN